ncbi:MAG: acyltransferase family protein [Rhizonema sp. PD38]|nr:acyltransferase family protein [Rhizonema sp. PD38]
MSEFSNITSHSEKYRPEIDGLRALAVIAVIINHFNKNLLPSGFLGVDIFFVISGYVITSSLASKEHKSVGNFLLGFYARRIKRIMPALIVCITITCVIGFLFIPVSMDFIEIWHTGIAALFGLSNIHLFRRGTDYFVASTELNLFTQTWSLGVEEQFYLIFPLLFWFSGFARKISNGKRNLLFFMILLSTLSLCIYVWLSRINPSAAYFLIPSRFWELGTGCITFLLFPSKKRLAYISKFVSPLLITTLMIIVLFIPQVAICESTIGVVLLTSFLITALNSNSIMFRVFTCRPVVFIGVISYSLYLWHWSILAISRWTTGISWWTLPIQIGLIFLIAWLSYRYIEKNLRYITWSGSQFATISYGIGASLVASVLLFLLGNPLKGMLYVGYPADFLRNTWAKDANGNYIEYCHVQNKYSENIFNDCIIDKIKPEKKRNIYLFGDSHARNYLNGVKKAFPEYNVTYITMGSGCAYIPENQISTEVESLSNCREYVMRVKDFVKNEVKVNDVVFIGQRKEHQSDIGYQENILELATYSQHRGAKFVLLADVPGLLVDPAYCMKEPWRHQQPTHCFKTIHDVMSEQDRLDKIGLLLQTKMSNFRYLNVRSHLCVNQLCSLYEGDSALYYDHDHITDATSAMLAPYIREQLLSFLLPEDKKLKSI